MIFNRNGGWIADPSLQFPLPARELPAQVEGNVAVWIIVFVVVFG
jgi:hypothetical protein